MIRFFIVVIFLGGTWSAAWYITREVLQFQLAEISTASDPQDGSQNSWLRYSDQEISGFPGSLNWQIDAPLVTFWTPPAHMIPSEEAPGALPLLLGNPVFWQAGRVALDTGLARPLQFEGRIQGPQLLGALGQEITVDGPDWASYLALQTGWDLGVADMGFEIPQASLSSTWGWNAQLDMLSAALTPIDTSELTPDEVAPESYQLDVVLDSLVVDDIAQGWPDAITARELHIKDLRIEADLDLTAALDRHLAEQGLPAPGLLGIRFHQFGAELDGMRLSAEGDIRFDQAGRATGELRVRVDEWAIMGDIGQDLGMLDPDEAMFFMGLLANMAQSTEPPEQLEVILRFTEGRAQLGPLELGTLPALPVQRTGR